MGHRPSKPREVPEPSSRRCGRLRAPPPAWSQICTLGCKNGDSRRAPCSLSKKPRPVATTSIYRIFVRKVRCFAATSQIRNRHTTEKRSKPPIGCLAIATTIGCIVRIESLCRPATPGHELPSRSLPRLRVLFAYSALRTFPKRRSRRLWHRLHCRTSVHHAPAGHAQSRRPPTTAARRFWRWRAARP
jgi:hypothetical protein